MFVHRVLVRRGRLPTAVRTDATTEYVETPAVLILIVTRATATGVTTGLARIKTITAKHAEATASVPVVTASMGCAAQRLVTVAA